MIDNSNITLNDEDIKIDLGTLIIKPLGKKFIPVELKQQILNNQEIVQRLKEIKTKDILKGIPADIAERIDTEYFLDLIRKSILEKQA